MKLKRKGIDITFGDGNNCYGGILIRAIQNIATNEIFDGIGKIANLIIDEMGGANEITRLYESNVDIFSPSAKLHLANAAQENDLRIFKKNRQGLNLKKEDDDGYFLNVQYNYFTYPEITELI